MTHFDSEGRPKMVNVKQKAVTTRIAIASGIITLDVATVELIKKGGVEKGDVLATAQIAAIMAAKKTSQLIPMCHNIPLEGVELAFTYLNDSQIKILATTTANAKTGVEMEALTAVSVAALTIYDMVKAVDKLACISDIKLEYKEGGKSGAFTRPTLL